MQLKYFEMLFDEVRAKKKVKAEMDRRIAAGKPRIDFLDAFRRLRELGGRAPQKKGAAAAGTANAGEDERHDEEDPEDVDTTPSEDMRRLKARVTAIIEEKSAYNWVQPSLWSSVLTAR